MSDKTKTMLYKKSILDIIMEPSSSSMKYFSSLILSLFLNKNEKLKIAMSLPDDLKFLKRQGLINILPNSWKLFLGGSSFHDDNDNGNDYLYHINDYDNQNINDDNIVDIDNSNNSNDSSNIPFFSLPNTMISSGYDDDHDDDHDYDDNTTSINSNNVTTVHSIRTSTDMNSNSSHNNDITNNNSNNDSNNDNSFEEIINGIISARTAIILETCQNTIKDTTSYMLMKVLSGCDLNDSTLICSFLASVSGLVYLSNIIEQRKLKMLLSLSAPSSSLVLSSSVIHCIQSLIGTIITPILTIATLTSGSAICVRHRRCLNPLFKTLTVTQSYVYRFQSAIAKHINRTQAIVLIAITFVSSLAIKFKIRFGHVKWLYQIALIRLLEIIKNMETNIERIILNNGDVFI